MGIETKIKKAINSKIETGIIFNDDVTIGIESNVKTKNEIEIEIKNKSNFNMKAMIKKKKPEFKPVTVHLRTDINEAIDKFVEGEGKGAKQELINKMLEMILKENNLLKI